MTTRTICLLLLACLSYSCRSSRSMQKEINSMKSDLYYELTSPEYTGEVDKAVYLDFIDYSNLDYYTTIKKRGGFAVPLLLFNYETNRFATKLGEGSLNQTYREFLTEALLAECNSSTCFSLINNAGGEAPDSVYHLEIKILCNETRAGVKLNEGSLIWFGGEYLEFPNHRVRSATTNLSIAVRLSRGGDCLLDKRYAVNYKQTPSRRGYEDSVRANEACLNTMTECLSLATKEIVENISRELNLVLAIP